MDGKYWDVVKVKNWMDSKTVVPGDATIQQVAELMANKNIGSVLVSIDEKVAGIITESDILEKVVAKGLDPATVTASQIMTTPLVKIDEDSSLEEAASLMHAYNIRRLPVINKEEEITGVIDARTICYALPIVSEAIFRSIRIERG